MSQRVRVFISHSARDGEAHAVRMAIRDVLTSEANKERYTVLMDDFRLEPGDAWRSRINLWLGSCDVAVVLISPKALQSPYVAFELSVLGYRKWRTERAGGEFRIIPVLTGVEMKDLEHSLLDPAQIREWMAVTGGDPATLAERVAEALDEIRPAAARPIENTARVLDAQLTAAATYLERAAAVLGVELPWDTAEDPRFCLALCLLGCGMSDESLKAIRQLLEDEQFRKKDLGTIIDILSSAWVGWKADEIRDLVSSADRPALALNAAFPDTARMYMTAAKYRPEKILKYQFAEPNMVIEELEDDGAYRDRIVEEVRRELGTRFGADTEDDLRLVLDDYAVMKEAVVVAIAAPSIQPPTVDALREAFPHVTFFLLTGPREDRTPPQGGTIHIIRPQLAPSDETNCRKQYADFCRRIHRP